MNKEYWHVFLKAMSGLLIISFFIRLGGDYIQIYLGNESSPIYVCAIIRALEFIIPSIIIYLSAKYFEGKYNKEEEEEQ